MEKEIEVLIKKAMDDFKASAVTVALMGAKPDLSTFACLYLSGATNILKQLDYSEADTELFEKGFIDTIEESVSDKEEKEPEVEKPKEGVKFPDALQYIVDNWELLNDKQKVDYSKPQSVAVWCGRSDTAGSYEVDEEWIGVSPQGNIIWAYASGCSCWDGDFSEERFASLKEVTLNHEHTPEDWENVIIKFVETGVMQQM